MKLLAQPIQALRQWHIGRRLHRHLVNWREVRDAYFAQRDLPPFQLRDGRQLFHGKGDSPVLLLLEIFDDKMYRPTDALRPLQTVFDLGANIGFFSVWVCARYPSASVLAFEPNPSTARQLRANLEGNALHQVTVREEAAAGASGSASFLAGEASVLGSLQKVALPEQSGVGYTVPTRSLSDCIKISGKEVIDLCKVDIEGAEGEMLQASDDRTLQCIREFIIEVHDDRIPGALAACSARLVKAGFKYRARWLAKGRLSLLRAWQES
jgi:FkbM family methyltransferase